MRLSQRGRSGCNKQVRIWGALLIVLLFSPNLMLAFGSGTKSIFTLPGLSFSVMSLGLALLLLGLFRRPSVMFLFFLPLYAVVPLEIYFIYVYQLPSTVNIVATVLTSNIQEAQQYVGGMLAPAILSIVSLMIIGISGIYSLHRSGCSLSPRLRLGLIVSGCLMIGVIFAKNVVKPGHDADGAVNQTAINIERTFPVGFLLRIWRVYEEQHRFREIAEQIAGFHFDAHLKDPSDGAGINMVMVIGESLRQASLSLGGYDRDTTPRLRREPGLVSYSDATAAASLTRTSVPLMITRATASNPDRALSEKSLIGLFSEAGYQTWWLSNQEEFGGINNSTITALAVAADHVEFFNHSVQKQTTFDDVLLSPLAQALSTPGPTHRFVILHTMGNHWDYRYRYPETFDHWQPSLRRITGYDIGSPEIKANMINAYDNATLYTDHVLSEIITLLKKAKQPGVLVFMPDHGENLFDDKRLLTGHAHDSAWDLQVPLVLWATESYRSLYPEMWQQVIDHRDFPVSADNLFYSIAELGRIGFSSEEPVASIANVNFKPVPRQFLSISGTALSTDEVIHRDHSSSL